LFKKEENGIPSHICSAHFADDAFSNLLKVKLEHAKKLILKSKSASTKDCDDTVDRSGYQMMGSSDDPSTSFFFSTFTKSCYQGENGTRGELSQIIIFMLGIDIIKCNETLTINNKKYVSLEKYNLLTSLHGINKISFLSSNLVST
jgi:hypothetical protein